MSDDVFSEDIMDTPVHSQKYSQELVSKKIKGRQRTFFIDLKESSNGKFIKISELSRGGQRSTIMFDGEDIDHFIEAFQEIKASLS
ncbi:MAG: DNA-binding protein [Candidatus Altimarinota bacterium]